MNGFKGWPHLRSLLFWGLFQLGVLYALVTTAALFIIAARQNAISSEMLLYLLWIMVACAYTLWTIRNKARY